MKSQVLPSMKKTSAYSCCYIVLGKNGLVQRVFCGSQASIDGRGNHVASTLFCLEEFCKTRVQQESCASKKCQWNIPKKRNGEVVCISDTKFVKHEYGKKKANRAPTIKPNQDVRGLQRDSSSSKIYNILSKVISFQKNKGKTIGPSHVLQNDTVESLRMAVDMDHGYALPMSKENATQQTITKESKNIECLSPIKVHLVSLSEMHLAMKEQNRVWLFLMKKSKELRLKQENNLQMMHGLSTGSI